MRRVRWFPLIILAIGLGLIYGGVSSYRDQHSGTAGTAKVTECRGGSGQYDEGLRCTGTWKTGGDLVGGDGRIVVGRIEGAGTGDLGKTIDVRIHGDDHATKPSIGTPIMFWVIGGLVGAFGLFSLLVRPHDPDAAAA